MTTQQTIEVIAVVTGSGVGGVLLTKASDWVISRATSKKVAQRLEAEAGKFDAEAVQAITSAAVALVAPLQAEVTKLTERVVALEDENKKTKTLLQLAIEYIRALRLWIDTQIPDKSPPQPPADLGL